MTLKDYLPLGAHYKNFKNLFPWIIILEKKKWREKDQRGPWALRPQTLADSRYFRQQWDWVSKITGLGLSWTQVYPLVNLLSNRFLS